VAGTVWYTEDPSHLGRLQEYEMGAFKLCDCEVELNGFQKLPRSKIFCWAGPLDIPELQVEVFDFGRYQNYFTPSVVFADQK
jgi:hypothetical protein